MQLVYTMPRGYRGLILGWCGGTPKGDDIQMKLPTRPAGGSFTTSDVINVFQSSTFRHLPIPLYVPPKSDVRITASSSAGSMQGFATIYGMGVKDMGGTV